MKQEAASYQFLLRPEMAVRGNVTTHVTDALRQAIVMMELKPGDPIDKAAICDRLGVSRFPVSEALARLQAEGLVDILPQRGTTVSRVRIADVEEYMLIRQALESEAVRALVGNHGPDLIADLRNNLAYQRAAAELGDRRGFHARDLEFHDMLFSAMRFDKIRTIIESARANLDRARRLILSPRRLALTIAEHQAIVDAIANNDANAAADAMRAHLNGVMVELLAFARDNRSLFADGDRLEAGPK